MFKAAGKRHPYRDAAHNREFFNGGSLLELAVGARGAMMTPEVEPLDCQALDDAEDTGVSYGELFKAVLKVHDGEPRCTAVRGASKWSNTDAASREPYRFEAAGFSESTVAGTFNFAVSHRKGPTPSEGKLS